MCLKTKQRKDIELTGTSITMQSGFLLRKKNTGTHQHTHGHGTHTHGHETHTHGHEKYNTHHIHTGMEHPPHTHRGEEAFVSYSTQTAQPLASLLKPRRHYLTIK